MDCWTAYSLVLLSGCPDRAVELLKYQDVIIRTYRSFPRSDVWLRYDHNFRRKAACSPVQLDWGATDLEVFHQAYTSNNVLQAPPPSYTPARSSHPHPQRPWVASRIVDGGTSVNTAMAHTAWSSAVVLRIAVDLFHALAPRPAPPTRRGLFVPTVRAQPPHDDCPTRPDVRPSLSSYLFGLPEPQDSECLPRHASHSSLPAPPAIMTEHHSIALLHASLVVPAGSSSSFSPVVSPPALGSVTAASSLAPLPPASAISPIVLPALATELQHHPDKSFSKYLLSGFTDGFRVGFQPALVPQLHSASSNMRSALQNPQVVNAYLAREAQIGRIPGPFPYLDSALSPSVAALASGDSSWTYPSQLGIALTTASTGRTSPCHMPDTTQTYKALTLRELLGQWLVFMFPHCRHVRRW